MSPRRSSHDPLAPANAPRWLVVRNMHRKVLEHRLLPPGSDLRGAFVKALAAHADAGWQLETFSSDLACAFLRPRSRAARDYDRGLRSDAADRQPAHVNPAMAGEGLPPIIARDGSRRGPEGFVAS
jgi:hypothetical protein